MSKSDNWKHSDIFRRVGESEEQALKDEKIDYGKVGDYAAAIGLQVSHFNFSDLI